MKYVLDDGGRAAAGIEGKSGDCVVRAVAIATEQPYLKVHDALWRRMEKHVDEAYRKRKKFYAMVYQQTIKARRSHANARNGVQARHYQPYLKNLGFEWYPLNGTWADVPKEGRVIVHCKKDTRIGGHLCAVVNGVVRDIWDTREKLPRVFGFFQYVK